MNILKRKNQKQTRRQPSIPGQSSPVVRYYRPPVENSKKIPKKKVKNKYSDQNDQGQSTFKKLLNTTLRWSGSLAVLAVIIINTTMSTATTRITSFSEDQTKLYRTKQAYSDQVKAIFSESLLYKSKFTLNTQKYEDRIKEIFPEVERASVVIPLAGRNLQVSLKLVEPLMRLSTPTNQEAIISDSGVVLRVESQEVINASFANLPLLSLPNIEIVQGAQLLTSDEVELIALLKQEFDGSSISRYQLKTVEFDIQKREVRARFESVPFYAKLTPERTPRSQVGALVATVEQLTGQGSLPQEYIDVRVDDRVFIK